MKQCVLGLLVVILFATSVPAQSQEAQQLLLDIEKLAQLKNILTDLKKGYEIISGGYNTIKNISEGNFNLHQSFLNSLLEVSPAVKKYKRVVDIIDAQIRLVSEYKSAFKQLKRSGEFIPSEIEYIGNVYLNLFNQSVENLGDLANILTANKLRMSDDERLTAIDDIWREVSSELTFLRHFNNQTKILALQRAKDDKDITTMDQMYNVNQ